MREPEAPEDRDADREQPRSGGKRSAPQPVDTSCIEYTGSRDRQGYGKQWSPLMRRSTLAHRVAWEKVHGEIPPGVCVLHHCDNPPCVNVDHLYLGSRADNARDRTERDRHGFKKYYTEEERKAAAREIARQWRLDNPERHRENLRRFHEKNPGKQQEYNKRSAARKKARKG